MNNCVNNKAEDAYINLILTRDEYICRGLDAKRRYLSEYGDLLLKLGVVNTHCTELSKRVTYCKKMLINGRVDFKSIEDIIIKEMEAYEDSLRKIIKEVGDARKYKDVTEDEKKKCLLKYREMAEQIHPDINYKVASNGVMKGIWEDIVKAYHMYDLKELNNLEEYVEAFLNALDLDYEPMDIEDYDELIADVSADIIRIQGSEPYTYTDIMDNPSNIEKRRYELESELKEKMEYREFLKKEYERIL